MREEELWVGSFRGRTFTAPVWVKATTTVIIIVNINTKPSPYLFFCLLVLLLPQSNNHTIKFHHQQKLQYSTFQGYQELSQLKKLTRLS
jgi:hypothetical protein